MRWYAGQPEFTLIQIVGPEIFKRAKAVQFSARGLAGHETGRLSASIQTTPVKVTGYTIHSTIGTDVPYAMYNHDGTGIFGPNGTPICAKRKPYLVFWIDGRKIVTKCVKGYPGTHFLVKALKVAQDWPVTELR